MFLVERQVMTATAGYLQLLVDSTSVSAGESVLTSFEKTGAKVEKNVTSNMAQVEKAMKRLGQQTTSTEDTASMLSKGFQKLGIEANSARMGMRMLPYQLNQIAQSGAVTGQWMRSITTQIPDILAGFGSMQLVLAGGGAAMAAAFLPALIGTSASMSDFADRIEDAEDALSEYKSAAELAAMTTAQLEEKFGSAGRSMQTLLTVIEDLKRREGQRAIDDLSASMSDMLAVAGDGEKRGAIADFFDVNIFLAFSDKAREARDVARELTGDFLGAQRALDYAATIDDATERLNAQIVAAEQLLNVSIDLAEADGERTAEEDTLITKIAESLQQMRLLRGAVEDTANAEELKAKAAQEIVDKYDRQAAMALAIATYGKDSAEVEALKREEAILAAQAMIDQKGLSGDVAQNVLNAANAAFDAEVNSANAAVALRDAETAAKSLADAMAAAAGFSMNLENGVRVLEAQVTALQNGADAAIASTIETMKIKAEQSKQAQIAAGVDRVIAEAQYSLDMSAISAQETLLAQKKDLTAATKKASSASSKHARQIERELDAVRKSLSPLSAYNEEMAKLAELRGYLTDDEFAQAIRNLNVELADSLPLVGELTDSVVEGLFNGFDDTLGSIRSIFKSWLIEMVSMAAKNQIVMSMGLSTTGAAGTVAGSGVASGAGSLGILGNILTGGSGLVSGLVSGAGLGLTNLLGGGVSSYISGLGAQAAAIFADGFSASALGGLIGSIAGPVAIVTAAISFFSSKTKLLDSGLRVTADNMDLLLQSFSTVEKSRFWGLSKSVSTSYGDLDAETAAVISDAIAEVQTSVQDYAGILGIGAAAFKSFAYVMEVSTKGMTDEEAQEALLEAFSDLSDAYAGMVPYIEEFAQSGETTTETLARLSDSLAAVNDVADLLGRDLFEVSLAGADAASRLVEYFGDLDTMTSAVTTYWQTVYSETDQQETAVRRLTSTFEALGYAMPKTRDQYRALVESIDLSTDAGLELYATFISLAGAMDAVLPSVSALTEELAALQGTTQTGLEAYVTAAETAAKANATAASNWYKASDSIRDYISDLLGSSTALTDPLTARAYNEATYQTTLASALAGDLDAAGNLTSVAENLRQSVNDTASTRVEAALAEARILSDLQLAAGVGDIEGARHDVIAGLLTDQADLMQETADYLAAGNALTEDMIDTLQSQLGSLDNAIAAAELINYQYLKDRLQVTVDVLADADVPKYLRNLLTNAAEGVTGYIDFLVRSDLDPDLKWLALTGASEHVSTIEYLAENKLGRDLTKLAVDTVSSLEKTVNLLVGAELDHDTMQVALAGNSELSRIVNATLSDDIDKDAKILALTDISDHMVRINGKIGDGNTKAMTRLLRSLGGATDGTLTLGGSFVFDPSGSFETLFGDSIEKPMEAARAAMGTLTGALGDLRAAIAAETARAEKDTAISALNSYVSSLETDANGNPYVDDKILSKMSSITGVDISGMGTKAAANALASYSDTDAFDAYTLDKSGIKRLRAARVAAIAGLKDTVADVIEFDAETGGYLSKGGKLTYPLVSRGRLNWSSGAPDAVKNASSDDLATWRSTWWANGGLEDQLWAADRAVAAIDRQIASFDGGGWTGDWARSGGWDGKGGKLGLLHPNEKVTTSAQNDELLAEVRRLNKSVDDLRDENAAQARRLAFLTKKMVDIVDDWDTGGIPEERIV